MSGIGDNSFDEQRMFERFQQLYRERFENDEALKDLCAECKSARYDDTATMKAVAQESVAPEKHAKRTEKDRKRAEFRERMGLEP